MNYKDYIAIVEDFPIKGISFKDITPLLADGAAFKLVTNDIKAFAEKVGANLIVGPESRGFIFGCPVAVELGIGFAPIRKPGKLPRETVSKEYSLEYGSNTLCMHADAVKKGDKVLIVDDLLATGGTIGAAVELIESLGATVVGCAFVVELTELKGREKMKGIEVLALTEYPY